MGINPEGDGSKTLLRAVPRAAKMILLSAVHNYNIVCVATDFRNNTFSMTVDPPLDNGRIQEARSVLKGDEDKLQQLISDYAMARIAKHLPAKKQGYYSNPEEFINAFESLTS